MLFYSGIKISCQDIYLFINFKGINKLDLS